MRRRNVKNAKQRIENHPELVIANPKEYIGKWHEVFNNDNPIYLEIGMGKGKFLREHALKNPNINYIGIEKFDKAVELFSKSIEIEQNSDVYMDLGNAYASRGWVW